MSARHPAGQSTSDSGGVSLRVQPPCVLWAPANRSGAVFTHLPTVAIQHSQLFQDLLTACGTPSTADCPYHASSVRSDDFAVGCPDSKSGCPDSKSTAAHNGGQAPPGPTGNPTPPPPPTAPTVMLPVPSDPFAAWLDFVCVSTAEPAVSCHSHLTCCAEPAALRQPRLLPAEELQGVLQVADLVIDMRTVETAARMLGAALFLSPTPPSADAVQVRRDP